MNKQLFYSLLPYLNKKFYFGHIRWLMLEKDKKGKLTNAYCLYCGNFANGVVYKHVGHFIFNFPICKKHIQEFRPQVNEAPFYVS